MNIHEYIDDIIELSKLNKNIQYVDGIYEGIRLGGALSPLQWSVVQD